MHKIEAELRQLSNPTKAKFLARYFKTGAGEYAAGDKFLGLTVPQQRALAKKYRDLPRAQVGRLLASPIHEFRLTALLILVEQYGRGDTSERAATATYYLNNLKSINNWDLVDTSAPAILGNHFFSKDKAPLYKLARSKNLWHRRIAILTTQEFIRRGQFADTLAIAALLLKDPHALIHKAVGWMLREVGNRDRKVEQQFLDQHYRNMPRTMLRYAIEKFDEPTRQRYLK